MNKFFFGILFTALFVAAYPQSNTIRGRVVSTLKNEPLPYANIRVVENGAGAATNKFGNFELKLPDGSYTFIASYIGFISDTLSVKIEKSIDGFEIKLAESSVNLPEITVLPGENPALEILRRAIQRRNERNAAINSYEHEGFTKFVVKTNQDIAAKDGGVFSIGISTDDTLIIGAIFENHSKLFFKKPDRKKEVILARRQTANVPSSVNTLTGGRLIQNFYEDDIQFFNRDMINPISERGLNYYYFILTDTISRDNHNIFQIFAAPDDSLDPGFAGNIFISDKTFDLVKIDFQLNRAANTGGLFEKVSIIQQFLPFENGTYMPVDYNLAVAASILGLVKLDIELASLLHAYKLNQEISDDFFSKAVVTVKTDADEKDSSYWSNTQTIATTDEENSAYKKIDSVESVPKDFWDEFSFFAATLNYDKNISFSGPLGLYHFNRVEGHALDFNFNFDDLFKDRFDLRIKTSHGFSDKKFKKELSARVRLGEYRTHRISFSAFDKKNVLFESSPFENEFLSSVLALASKYEFQNYYYSKGFKLDFTSEVLPVVILNGGISYNKDESAFVNSNFSFFAKKKSFPENKSIYNGATSSINIGFNLDFRDYIEDGMYRRRISSGDFSFRFGGEIKQSFANFFGDGINSTQYKINIFGRWALTRNTYLLFDIKGAHTNGTVAFQNLFALPGNLEYFSGDNTFRSLRLYDSAGDRFVTAFFNWRTRSELFRILGIDFLRKLEIEITPYFNFGLVAMSAESKSISPYPLNAFEKPLLETGLTLSQVMFPLAIDFGWRLTHRNENKFLITISSSIVN